MYEGQFKKWKLSKYLTQTKRDEILDRVVRDVQTQPSQPDPDFSGDDLRKLLRYLKERQIEDESVSESREITPRTRDSSTSCGSSQGEEIEQRLAWTELNSHEQLESSESPIFSHGQRTSAAESYGKDSPNGLEQLAAHHYTNQAPPNEWPCESASPLECMPAHVNAESLNLETILRNVHSVCARTNLSYSGRFEAPDQVSPNIAGALARFWSELKHGIYLLKISCFDRAFPALYSAGELADGALTDNPLAFVREIFSTLSPINTATCSGLRVSLLRGFSILASRKLERTDPIVVLCKELQNDGGSQEVSERALSFMIDLLTSIHGISYALALKAQTSYICLLRRNKDYARAGNLARRLVSSSNSTFGAQSRPARLAARELEHVLIDEEKWHEALEVCHSIVDQQHSSFQLAEPHRRDECAVYTMEDIAKIYANVGETKSCIAWLTQAANSAWMLWGSCVATRHIVDKLVGALMASGEADEADFWRNIYANDASDITH